MANVDELDVFGYPSDASGVFSDRLLEIAVEREVIEAGRFKMSTENIQPASIDLRLGEWAHRIRCSFLPGNDTVEQRLKEYGDPHRIDLREGALLESGTPYLIELKERLNLPPHVQAKANPKSSTGRVDVFTRVITDRGHRFDEVKAGYRGPLYLEVVPLSFAVRVREDLTLNQLRLFVGQPELTDAEIRESHEEDLPILFREGKPVRLDSHSLSNGLFLGLDLRGGPEGRVGFSAKDGAPPLDLTTRERVNPELYWSTEKREDGDRIVLHPKKFYLLMSDEAVSIPPTMSAEMTAYDPTSGELRTHYAGFFDPGFGYDGKGRFFGSRAALEVRAHDVPFMIENGQPVCKLTFQRMLEVPTRLYGTGIGSSYQQQDETLSKYFKERRPNLGTDGQSDAGTPDPEPTEHLFEIDRN
jgi:dCTP deaminase